MPALPTAQQDTDSQSDSQAVLDRLRAAQTQPQAQPQAVPAGPAPGFNASGQPQPAGSWDASPVRQAQAVPTAQPTAQAQPAPQQAQPQAQPDQAQPQGGQPTAQSEPAGANVSGRPNIDPRPYASLAEHAPQYRAMIDEIAEKYGTTPQRLALTWAQEGGFRTSVPDGKAGEKGPMQIMPSTAAQYDPKGQLNLNDLHDNLTAAARHISHLDSVYGQDTPSSVGAYQGGEGSIRDIMAHPERAATDHPNTMKRIQSSFPGQNVTNASFNGPQTPDPRQLINAAKEAGPDGFLQVVAQTAQSAGTNMTDAMRAAEASLVGFMASRGDIGGMQHARDFVLQMAHQGANENLMAASRSLGAGDGTTAAQQLAKAHAFFPDGTMGSFGVDSKGQVWGQRMDEHSGKPMGGMFQVDQNAVQQMLMQTRDPNQFMKMVQEERQAVATAKLTASHGEYYAGLDQERRDIAKQNNDAKMAIAGGHDDTHLQTNQATNDARVEAAHIRADARQGQGPAAALSKQADKEAANNYGPGSPGSEGLDPMELGNRSETFHDLRMNGMTEPSAIAVTDGVHSGKLQLVRGKDGSYGVMNPKDKSGQPIAVLSKSVGDRLAGNKGVDPQQPSTTPVGAGANTAVARATGVGSNLSGTIQAQPQQSSAIPTS